MKIDSKEENGVVIFSIEGQIDLYHAPELKDKIQATIDEGKNKIIINLEGVSYIDSSGIGGLISSYSISKKQQGAFRICHVSGSVRKVFELTKLTSFFNVDDTQADSLSAIN